LPGTENSVQVVGLGQASFDYLGYLPCYPTEDSKAELSDLRAGCGGPVATALAALSRFGVKTSFIGTVGDDRFGKDIIRFLKDESVDVSLLETMPGCTSQLAFIAVSPNGSRTIFWHPGTAPPPEPSEIRLSPFRRARVLHLDGLKIEASIEAARQAKAMGMAVVMDAGTYREKTGRLLPLVNILIASERFTDPLVGPGAPKSKAIEALASFGAEQVVITLGAKGSIGFDGTGIIEQPAFPITVVDTTGAGDVYHGAYIYRFLEGSDMAECMKFASAAAALKCSVSGNSEGLPGLERVLEFMKNPAPGAAKAHAKSNPALTME